MLYRGLDDAPVRRVDRNLASYVRPAPLDRSGFRSDIYLESFLARFSLKRIVSAWPRSCRSCGGMSAG
jgi:hypothetical protein